MSVGYMCEADGCKAKAAHEYFKGEYDPYDGVETQSTFRCANHAPEPSEGFAELVLPSYADFEPSLVGYDSISKCCGAPVIDGFCTDCREHA